MTPFPPEATGKSRLAEALQQSEERYRFLSETIPVQIWTATPAGALDYVSDQTARRLGKSSAELLAEGWQNVVHPEDLPLAIERWVHALETGDTYEVEFRLKGAAGDFVWHLARAVPRRGPAGEILQWFGTNTEIESQRKQQSRVQGLLGEVETQALRLGEQNRLLALEAEVGAVLVRVLGLSDALTACAELVVKHLDTAFARIWTVDDAGAVLELRASAGLYTHTNGPHGRVPVGKFKIGQIAAERSPHITNQVVGDPRVGDQEWAKREGMVAFVGYPLVLGDRLIGVIATFARHPLSEATVTVLGSIANGIAQTIVRRRAEDEVRASEAWLSTTLSSIGDGVVATDAAGAVSYLNPLAARLTGWSLQDARGRHLDEIFPIVNETTRSPVESPVTKVLREGAVVGMANHTILVRRDGTEVPIEDSAAPIRDRQGDLTGVVLVFRDATEKRHAEKEVLEAENVLRSFVNNLPDLAWSAMADGRIDFYNQRWFDYTGTTAAQMQRDGWQPIHDPAILPTVVERWTRCVRTGEPFEMEFPLRAADGSFRWFLTRVNPVRDGDGTIVRWFGTNTDIHAQREAARTLEEASVAKDEFLATASHELRTPLNAILGWARMLRSGSLDPSGYLRGVETIERNARAQVQLIEDILDGSRIITGKLHLEIRSLDMTALVEAALDAIRPAVAAKSIDLRVNLDPEAAQTVGDPERLQQIVWNLANNAVKFTPKGGTVEVRLERAGTYIELTVSDTGEGIAEDFLPHVFERFRQAEGSTTRRHGGLGLGLALVRHLVEAHGGSVRAESGGKGLGARFIVQLPVRAVLDDSIRAEARRTASGEDASAIRPAASLAGVTVLIVDDEADARDLVATVLRVHGAEVTAAANAAQAIEALAKSVPRILISDVGMPDADGYELMRRVRRLTQTSAADVPAIALTAYSREQDRRLALEAGFQTHVAKPVEPAELVRVVASLVGFVGRQSSPTDREAALAKADTFLKLEKILSTQGVHDALRFLNSRTSHRFTGVYRFEDPMLRNLVLVDSYAADVTKGPDAPMVETYCSIVGRSGLPFTTADTRLDDRVREHAARDTVISYCGLLLRDAKGNPYGTLCHFDLVPCDVPASEMPLLEAAAVLIGKAVTVTDPPEGAPSPVT